MQEKFHLYSETMVWDEQESTATNVRTILREEIRFFELLSQRANEQAHEKVRSNTLVAALEDRLQKYQAAYDKLHARYNDTTDDTIHKNLQAPMRVCEKLIRSLSKRVKKMKTQENDEQAHYLSELLREKQEDFAELNAEQLERYAAKADTSLARTGEYFRIPRDILVVCLGKSTYARCGIIVNVTPLEPEWEGHITLEFSNTTPLPARIYANEGIAQFLFFQADADDICETSYKDRGGKYQGQTGVTLPRT
jgi:deoxycytidine triphosphate deaminase